MDVRQLRYFVTIVSKGSFTKASELLGIAQPSLGAQIRKLEEEMHVQLLVRNARGVQLTEPGRVLFERGQRILADMAGLEQALRNMAEEPHGPVALGVTPSLADRLIIPLIERIRQQFPHVALSVTEEMSHTLVELIEVGQLDMAVIFNATPSRGLSIRRLSAEAICLLHQPVDGDAGLSPVPFAQVAQYPLILPRRPHRLRQLADDAAEQCKIRLNVAYEMQSLSTILRLVEEGFGATLIAETMARRKAQEGRLVARHVVQPSMRHDIALIYLDSKPLSRAEHAVAGIMAEMVRASFPEQHAPAETAPADR